MDAKPPLTDWWLLCIVFVSLWDYEVMTYFRHAIFVDDSISHVNNERMGIRRLTFAWRDLPGSLLSCISLPPCPPKRRRECCTVQRQPVVYSSAKLPGLRTQHDACRALWPACLDAWRPLSDIRRGNAQNWISLAHSQLHENISIIAPNSA